MIDKIINKMLKDCHIFKFQDIYFASWKNPPILNDYFLAYRSKKDRKVISQTPDELFEFVKTIEVENIKEAKEKIEAWYHSDNKCTCDAIAELEKLKKAYKELQEKYDAKTDRVSVRNKKYYERNKERIKCDCGSSVTKINYKTHLKSQKHLKWVSENS